MKLRTFFGIVPPRISYDSSAVPMEECSLPGEAVLFGTQDLLTSGMDIGEGDLVKTGQPFKYGSAEPFYSTVTGRIKEISLSPGMDGRNYTCIKIEVSKKEEWDISVKPRQDYLDKNPDEVADTLKKLGLSMNFRDYPGSIESLIISAVDMDPESLVNRHILLEKSNELARGVSLVKNMTGTNRIFIAIPQDISPAKLKVPQGLATVVRISPVYPNGFPEMLKSRIAGLAPETSKTLYLSAENVYSMVQALETGRPIVEKYLTLGGTSVPEKKIIKARIGTPVSEILETNGIPALKAGKILLGGVMCGTACPDPGFPILPDTHALYVQDASEITEYEESSCVNCGKCSAICPVNLEVNLLARHAEYSLFDNCTEMNIDHCIECGLCSYVCIARRPLVQMINYAKIEIEKQGVGAS
jgi:electron transport complex protein RnfC